jgi:hypothetical protein
MLVSISTGAGAFPVKCTVPVTVPSVDGSSGADEVAAAAGAEDDPAAPAPAGEPDLHPATPNPTTIAAATQPNPCFISFSNVFLFVIQRRSERSPAALLQRTA